jgi:hypothetical protein
MNRSLLLKFPRAHQVAAAMLGLAGPIGHDRPSTDRDGGVPGIEAAGHLVIGLWAGAILDSHGRSAGGKKNAGQIVIRALMWGYPGWLGQSFIAIKCRSDGNRICRQLTPRKDKCYLITRVPGYWHPVVCDLRLHCGSQLFYKLRIDGMGRGVSEGGEAAQYPCNPDGF